jgi:hypothetical protein
MKSISRVLVTSISAGLLGLTGATGSATSYAAPSYHDSPPYTGAKRHPGHQPPVVIHRGPPGTFRPDRIRHYRNITIVRPHGRWYGGYGWYRADDDAYKWLSFTAITLKLLDNLNEQQQREHEAAQVRATGAAIGETIVWHKGGASGAVTVLRDGTSTTGRYCREFQQEVMIGGNRESAYGTACRNPDGSWEVVSTGSP